MCKQFAMGVIIRIKKNNTERSAQKELNKLKNSTAKKQGKTLEDFYGKLPNAFGDGMPYQKKIRNEWQ